MVKEAWHSELSARSVEQEIVDQSRLAGDIGFPTDGELPAIVTNEGAAGRFAWEEFFDGNIENENTRAAYSHAVRQFLTYCETLGLSLNRVSPRIIRYYIDGLDNAKPTKKLHLSAIRGFFDMLVLRHAVVLNPAASVKAPRCDVVEGKTPEISIENCRRLLSSINTTHVVGLRDRAVIAILIYTAARVGAVAKLRRCDFYFSGEQYQLRFDEKGSKSREIPVRQDLQRFIREYIEAACLEYSDKSSLLFRTTIRRTRQLTQNAMSPGDMSRMVKRRMRDAGLPPNLSPHSFRVTTITDLLSQNIPLEDVQRLAGHKDPRTTRLYDRRDKKVTRNLVERISI